MSEAIEHVVARYGLLLSVYGALLSEEGRRLMQLYYDEDMSLAEIASVNQSSRQAVSGALQRQRRLLDKYEDALGLTERDVWFGAKLTKARSLLQNGNCEQTMCILEEMQDRLSGEG